MVTVESGNVVRNKVSQWPTLYCVVLCVLLRSVVETNHWNFLFSSFCWIVFDECWLINIVLLCIIEHNIMTYIVLLQSAEVLYYWNHFLLGHVWRILIDFCLSITLTSIDSFIHSFAQFIISPFFSHSFFPLSSLFLFSSPLFLLSLFFSSHTPPTLFLPSFLYIIRNQRVQGFSSPPPSSSTCRPRVGYGKRKYSDLYCA
jgi:hypothetical protein